MEKITRESLRGMFAHVGKIMEENSGLLCEMDAKMGDGDLGLTMSKGFQALPDLLDGIDEADIGKCLVKLGMGMASVVPSTMGTLMASGIMGGGKALAGREEIDAQGYALYLDGFAGGIRKRGKCEPGDRTVLDAILPAAERARELLEKDSGAALSDVARAAFEGAEEGLAATKEMTPKFGKAAVFAARALGAEDQGAYAGMLMLRGYYEYVCRNDGGN